MLLALKADQLPREVATSFDIGKWLGCPVSLNDCVQQLVSEHHLVLLVDQLDALAELVDVYTSRLNAVHSLINELRDIEGVRVIVSCRTFDYQYDVRFSSLEANTVELRNPSWDEVRKFVSSFSAEVENWPESFKETLCVPQQLALFLEYFSEPPFVLDSYQAMLEELFRRRVLDEEGRNDYDTLYRVAREMADDEELWQPFARYDHLSNSLYRLVATGLLTLDHSRTRFAFRHQTIFDFVRARSFTLKESSLSDYVIARQESLFVRPTVWSALQYLRSADGVKYMTELRGLWQKTDLRLHLRFLLIAFLGRLDDPSDEEARLLLALLDDPSTRSKVMDATRGSRGWFKRIKRYLPQLMVESDQTAWEVALLFQSANEYAQTDVIDYSRQHWLANAQFDNHLCVVFNGIKVWNQPAALLAKEFFERTSSRGPFARHIVSGIAHTFPNIAAKIVAVNRAGILGGSLV